jgi:serine/threonine protein kinase
VSDAAPAIAGLTYLQPLGSGGYSDVYLYEQAMPHRRVAVKVLRRGDLGDNLRRQFVAEANAMAALSDHPHIVPVYSTGETDDGRSFLLMSYFSRPNLGRRAATERLSVAEVLRIGIQVASAVETAHRAGILHRDIKPANILTSQYGAPGLTDFGIAAQLAAVQAEDEDTGVSVPWAPPEALYATAPASVRSDIYSLGATLWHLLVGRSPFEIPGGDNKPYALMCRIRDNAPPGTGRADVPTSLERLLQQTMAKDPSARPASAMALARSLQAIEQEMRLARTEIVVLTDEQTRSVHRTGDTAAEEATYLKAPARIPSPTVSPVSSPLPRRASPAETGRRPVSPPPPSYVEAEPAVDRPAPMKAGSPTPPTIHRPTIPTAGEVPPTGGTAPHDSGKRRWLIVGAITAVVCVSLIVGVVLSRGGGKGDQPSTSTNSIAPQDPANAGEDIAPGDVELAGKRVGPATVKFTWTYSASRPTDTFAWRTRDGAKSGTVSTPELTVADATGTQMCIQIKVFRADGSNGSVSWSPATCVS